MRTPTRSSHATGRLLPSLMVAALGVSAIGGSSLAQSPAAPTEPVSFTVWTPPLLNGITGYEDIAKDGAFVQYLAEQYMAEHPGVTIDLDIVSFQDIEQRITTAVAGDVGPDVYVDVSPRLYTQWRTGAWESLDGIWSADEASDFLPAAWTLSLDPVTGEQFYAPLSNYLDDRLVLVEDFWAEKGLLDLLPETNGTWTIEEFETAMAAIADPANNVYPLCGEFLTPGAMDQVRFVYQNGGLPFSPDDQAVAAENKPDYVRGLSKVYEWYKNGWFVPEPQAFVDGDCWLQFAMKTVAVLFFPDAAIGIAKDAIENAGAEGPYALRYVAWPTFEGEKPEFQANGLGFMVKKQDSDTKRAVIRDFIRWMTSAEKMELYKSDTTYGAFIYPRKSLDYEGYLVPAQWFADQQAIQTDPAWGGLMTGYGFYSGNYTATRACAAPEWQAVFNGQKTAEEAVDAIFACNQTALDAVN